MNIGEYKKWREYRDYCEPEILEPGPEHRDEDWGMELYALTKEQMQALMDGKQMVLTCAVSMDFISATRRHTTRRKHDTANSL